MTKRAFQVPTWTPNAFADAATISNNNYMNIGASNAAIGLLVSEIYIGGQGSASAPSIMMFARNSTQIATPAALPAPSGDGPLATLTGPTQAQQGSITAITATTGPQRSASVSAPRLNLSLNLFGGIVRWVAYPGEEWQIQGVTVNVSESSLSAFTGSTAALAGSHIVYECY
jgi:hypothetical protein